jgi:hypothetical protein
MAMNVTTRRPANDHRRATRAIAAGRWLTRLCAALLCWTLIAHLGAHSAPAFQVDPIEQDAQEYTHHFRKKRNIGGYERAGFGLRPGSPGTDWTGENSALKRRTLDQGEASLSSPG